MSRLTNVTGTHMTAVRLTMPAAARALAMLLLPLAALACGGGDKGATGVTPPDTTSGGPPATPNPLTVHVVTDPARAVTQRVRALTGGSLQATAADGSRFTLTIFPGALAADTTITMTPIARVDDLPFTGLLAGVDLAPDGLRFLGAILSIEPAKSFDAQSIDGAGYHGSGEEFYLTPIAVQGSTIVLQLAHFSGKMIIIRTPQQRSQQSKRVPTRRADQIDQQLALRQTEALVQALQTQYLDVAAELEAAKANEYQLPTAVSDLFQWQMQVSLAGVEGRLASEMADARARLAVALTNARTKVLASCTDFENADQLEALQWYVRVATLFDVSTVKAALDKAAVQCRPSRIKLTLASNIIKQLSGGDEVFNVTVGGSAEGYLYPDRTDIAPHHYATGTAGAATGIPFAYSAFRITHTVKGDGCRYQAVDTKDGVLTAELDVEALLGAADPKPGLWVQPGSPPPLERVRMVGAESCATPPNYSSYWTELFSERVSDGLRDPNLVTLRHFMEWPGQNGTRSKTFAGRVELTTGPNGTGTVIGYIDGTVTLTLAAEFDRTP